MSGLPAGRVGQGGRRRVRALVGVLGAHAVAAAVLGVTAGAVWAALVPQVTVQRVPGGLLLDERSGAASYAFDGWFGVVAVAGGLLLGIASVPAVRRHGWRVVPVTAAAALAAGLVQWWVGTRLDRGGATVPGASGDSTGQRVALALSLSGHAALALWPLATCVVLVAVSLLAPGLLDASVSTHRSPRGDRRRGDGQGAGGGLDHGRDGGARPAGSRWRAPGRR